MSNFFTLLHRQSSSHLYPSLHQRVLFCFLSPPKYHRLFIHWSSFSLMCCILYCRPISLTFLLFLPWQPSPTLQLLAPLSLSLSLSLSLYLSLSPSPSLLSSPFPFYIFSLSFFSLLHYLLFTVLCSNGISYSF